MGCLQLFGCAFFAWIFAEAVHLYLSTRIVINKGDGRLALFYFIGWGIVILILKRVRLCFVWSARIRQLLILIFGSQNKGDRKIDNLFVLIIFYTTYSPYFSTPADWQNDSTSVNF